MSYIEYWGHWIMVEDYGPEEPDRVECPKCGTEVDRNKVRPCEWCNEAGCTECMLSTVDGWVCGEECGEALRSSYDEFDEMWDQTREERKQKGDDDETVA